MIASPQTPATPAPKKPPRRKKRIKVCYLRVEELSKESRERLFAAARQCQEATNRFWQRWEQHMLANRRDEELREFLDDWERWKASGQSWDDRPRLEFSPLDPEFLKRVTGDLRVAFPFLHARVQALLVNATSRRILSLPSRTCGKLKLWQAALLSREAPSRSAARLPIPFDRQNASLAVRAEDGALTLGVRMDRFEVEGHVNGASHLDTMRLRIEGAASRRRYAAWTVEAARGERPWAGSQLVYDGRKRQWYVALAVEVDAPPPLGAVGETAVLSAPTKDACWLLESGERRLAIGGGHRVVQLRRRLQASRFGTRSDPFDAPSRTGHGRRRRRAAATRREGKWGRCCKTLNRQAVARVIKELRVWGITRLDYRLPTAFCLLNAAGIDVGLPAWPLYQFSLFLRQTCADVGIALRMCSSSAEANPDGVESCDQVGCGEATNRG